MAMEGASSSSSKRASPSPDWSQLPPKPLHLISQKLTLIFDYISFRSVCSRWRSAAKPTDLPPQLPLFMIPYDPFLDHDTREIFSLTSNKLYTFDLPEAREKRCLGSNHGWLLALGAATSVFLLNPFTKSQIKLPPITKMPAGYARRKSGEYRRDWLVIQAVISSNPSDGDCVVMVALYDTWKLAFCRPGDKSWTGIDAGLRGGFGSLAYHGDKFYAIDGDGRVAECDVTASPPAVNIIPTLKWTWDDQCYLASSGVGLLLIVRYRHGGDEGDDVGGKEFFDVFKMVVPEGKKPRWRRINRLDGEALFLCDNHGLALRASDFPGIRANCIYYSNPFYNFQEYNSEGHDVGVFSMEDHSIKMIHCYDDDSLDWKRAVWLRPSLH